MDNPLKRPLDVYEVLGSLTGVKSYGDYWGADCPVPGHKTPKGHLTVRDALDKALVTCHGRGHGYEEICRVLGFDSLAYGKNGSKPMDESKIVAMYNYTDAAWKLLYQVVRYEPKDFRQRRPNGNGGWHWDLKGVNPVLYRLPEVLRATNDGQTVYVVEGERDADNLGKQGLAATCNPMGAGKWRDRYSEALEGANVVIVVDKDAPGRSHARNVASSLVGKAASIKVIELPGENVKDASDWLAAGGTKEALERLANEAPEWTRPGLATQSRFQLTPLSELLREPDEEIPFLWEKTLIRGGLSICAAKPKVGKSTLARNLALALARGGAPFLGRDLAGPCPVVYLALEEKRSQVKKHFERMGATGDLPIFIHTGSAPEEAIGELRKAVIESKAQLAIVDPLQRLVRIPDLNDYSSVSLALEPLMQIARDTGCHILLIHHASKGILREGGDSILGSTAIFGAVDCALIMKRGQAYRTIESIQRYGEDLPRTVLAFNVETGLTSSGGSLEDVEVGECQKSILELLADGEMDATKIKGGITDHNSGVVSKSLRRLYQDGGVRRQGSGVKGDPYRYMAVTENSGDSRDTPIEIPTIPTTDKGPQNSKTLTADGKENIPATMPWSEKA